MNKKEKLSIIDWMRIYYHDRTYLTKEKETEFENFVEELKKAINFTGSSMELRKDCFWCNGGNGNETGKKSPSNQIAYHEWYIEYVKWLERKVVKNCSTPDVVGRSEQLSFTDGTMPPMGSKEFDCYHGLCHCKQNCKA